MKNLTPQGNTQELESPFLNLTNFKQTQSTSAATTQITTPAYSPFKSVYQQEGMELGNDTESEDFVELMDELYDEEFDDILQEIAFEAQELYENQLPNTYNGFQNNEMLIQQSFNEHFSPFLKEVGHFMDYMVNIADQHDTRSMTDNEWDGLVDQYVSQTDANPILENFGWFKKIKNKIKKVAKAAKKIVKKGVSIAQKFGFGFILKKLKKIVFKFLKGILKSGINKLPRKYRSIAKKLAKKIGILNEVSRNETEPHFQQKLDSTITEFLLAPNEVELGKIEQEFLNEQETFPDFSLSQLDIARETFVSKVSVLQEGESPEPVIEEFVTAVLTGVKLAVRIIGKKKVKGIAVNLISKLIQKYIGKKYARMLSKQLVGAGFKMLNMELTPEQQVQDGNRAIASVVEQTAREIAEYPEHVLQNQNLLETNIVQAFERAAKVNFPDILSEETYIKRPDLRESSKNKVIWRLRAAGRGRKRKFRYKKLNKEIETELTPYLAQEIKTFNGVPLAHRLRDQMSIDVNRRIPVKVHLFETLPGANLFHVGRYEKNIQEFGNSFGVNQQIHPLTTVAAGLLMGEPALGCNSKSKCLAHKDSNAAHRYYYLEIAGARPQIYTTPSGIQDLRKTSGLKLKLNFIQNKIQLFLFLSETDAQNIASQIRQQMEANAVLLSLMVINSGLKTAFSKHITNNIMVVHPNVVPGKTSGIAMNYIPPIIQNKLKTKLKEWAEAKLSDYFMSQPNEFINAADADTDGVTVCITMEAPSDFNFLGQLINFKKAQMPEKIFAEQSLDMLINTKPGYHYV